MNSNLMYLPEQCYAVLPGNGQLVTITRGASGCQRSPLDTGSQAENRSIADQKNAELGGVSPEQEKDMVDGAVFGWEQLIYRNGGLFPNGKVFQVKISNSSPEGYATAVTLHLPATWAQFHDALEKARIEDARACWSELCRVYRKDLPAKCIGPNPNLYELNLLAQRLAWQTEAEKNCFEGMLKIEQARTSGTIPLKRLINITYNLDICCVAPGVKNDRELGRFLYENEMLSDEAMLMVDNAGQDSEYAEELLTVLGKKHREDMCGVFNGQGYLEATGGDLQDFCIPGEMSYFFRSDAEVVLEVRKGFFDDPAYDNNLVATLDLPTIDKGIWRAVEAVGAASPKECGYRCVDCVIPSAKELIDNAIDNEGGIGLVNKYARMLNQQDRKWNSDCWIKYKALLEASGCSDLREAMDLLQGMDEYVLRPEVTSTWKYAEIRLREKWPDLPEALFQTGQSAQIGESLMEQDNAKLTSYGLLCRKDGAPLPVFEPAEQHLTQRME